MNIVWSAQARRERVESIAVMPTLGHRVHEFTELPLRETHEGPYRIIYGFDDETLKIVTIVHMKQLLKRRRLG